MSELVPAKSRRPVLLVFGLTGASGLIYQVIWARQLGLVFGNTTTSISIVLSTFMAGLALGSWAAGKYLVQSGNPLRRYALFEGCIGLYAILFSPLVKALESLYPALLPDDAGVLTLTVYRSAGAFALLIVPTTLMGATLPLTTEYLHRLSQTHKDWNAGRLYAANTFGAAAGSFFSGYVLIELIGIEATTLLAASFNLLVMLLGLRLSKGISAERPAGPPPGAPAADTAESAPGHYRYLLLFALTGALALAGEVVWTRALSLLIGNTTYAFSAMLIVYLTGIAAGSWLMSGWLNRFTDIRPLLPAALIVTALWYGLAVDLVGPIYSLSNLLRTARDPSAARLVATVAAYVFSVLFLMIPGALLSGGLFPVITRLIGGEAGDQGKPIARAYTWNTVGCIAGSLIGGFVIAPNFFQFQSVYLLSFAAAGLGVAAAFFTLEGTSRNRTLGVMAVAAVFAAGWSGWSLTKEDRWVRRLREKRPGYEIPFHHPDLQGVTTVVYHPQLRDQTSLVMVNGQGMTIKTIATKAMAHLPLMLHGSADDTLVICFGMGTTFRSALTYGGRVDVVELMPDVFRVFDQFYADAGEVRASPKGRMIVNDGRNFLLLTKKKYDVITIDPPPPIDAAGVNNLYSKEFIELMRDHLKPGGIAAHWIPSVHFSNGLYDDLTQDTLIATFTGVFPYVKIYMDRGGLHLMGSLGPIEMKETLVDAALANPKVAADLNEYSWEPFVREQFFREMPLTDQVLQQFASLSPDTDDQPFLEFNLLRNAASRNWRAMMRTP